MCGRYASTKATADIASEFHAVDATGGSESGAEPGSAAYHPDYNVAPTKDVLTVVARHPREPAGEADRTRVVRSVRVMRWGLVPSWSKDASGAARMINARAETATEKPAFRKALDARRCLLPADGWYEWQAPAAGTTKAAGKATSKATGATVKQPYFITGTDGASLAMAGLWEFWRPAGGGEPLITASVLTTAAVGALAEIHHRMPLLLAAPDWADWLDPDTGSAAERIGALLAPPSEELVDRLELRPISTLVNNVRNEGPQLWERVEPLVTDELALDLG
ncbi:MAG TPA: SOS response-associated peptidase [Pseudonocardia sp.]